MGRRSIAGIKVTFRSQAERAATRHVEIDDRNDQISNSNCEQIEGKLNETPVQDAHCVALKVMMCVVAYEWHVVFPKGWKLHKRE